jgi:hypothetical protein
MDNQEETVEQKQRRITAREIATNLANTTAELNILKKYAESLDFEIKIGEMTNGQVVAKLMTPYAIGVSDNPLLEKKL